MPKPIQASMTVRWSYIIVALVVLVGLGYWLFSAYNVAPEGVSSSAVTTSTNPG